MNCLVVSTAVLALLGWQATTLLGQESASWWPQFRGPNASGVAEPGDYPTQFGPDKNLKWKTPLAPGHSSPCVWDNHLFLTCFDKDQQQLETVCLNRLDGNVMWRRIADAQTIEKVNLISSPAAPTPATDGERVYVYFGSCGLLAYDFEGNEIWKFSLPIPRTKHGSSTSPIVVDGKVILNVDQIGRRFQDEDGQWRGRSRSFLLAVDASTGKTVWRERRPMMRATYSVPIVWASPDGLQLLVQGRRRLLAYDVDDGAIKWWCNQIPPTASSTPIIGNGHVYLSGQDNSGEPDNVATLPTFDDFLEAQDANEDGVIETSEIPSDFDLVSRGRDDGAGSLNMSQWTPDSNEDGQVDREEWNNLATQLKNLRQRMEPGTLAVRLGGTENVTKTHITWRHTTGIPEVPSPLFHDNRIFYVKNGGIVFCRSAADGRELFKGRLGASSNFYASPVTGAGLIYAASESGIVVVFNSADSLNVLARNKLGERIMATPALVKGTIYIRGDKHLYAFAK